MHAWRAVRGVGSVWHGAGSRSRVYKCVCVHEGGGLTPATARWRLLSCVQSALLLLLRHALHLPGRARPGVFGGMTWRGGCAPHRRLCTSQHCTFAGLASLICRRSVQT